MEEKNKKTKCSFIPICRNKRKCKYKDKRKICFVINNYSTNNSNSNNTQNSSNLKNTIIKVLKDIIITVVVTVVATYLATVWATNNINKNAERILLENQHNNLIKNIENIYIGSSKDWANDCFGSATFEYTRDCLDNKDNAVNVDCCTYITEPAIISMYFDSDSKSCFMYYVTLVDDKEKISLPESFRKFTQNKYLGDFSYDDISHAFKDVDISPLALGGGVSNGNARMQYMEEYYYVGVYYNFLFMSLDYGINPGIESHLIIDTQNNEKYGLMVLDDRASCYPNTYGMYSSSLSNESIDNLLIGYNGFDSTQLRDKYNPNIVQNYIDRITKEK